MKRWIEIVLNRPWLFVGVVVLLTVGSLSFLPRIQFDASIDAMIPDDDPVLIDLQAVSEEFGSQELFFVAIESDDVFQAATLQKIAQLEQELLALPGVAEVQSPFNVQMVESSFFGIEIGPLAETVPQTPAEIEAFKDRILNSPYEGVLITSDGRGAALLLDLEKQADTHQVLAQIEAIVERSTGPENIHMVGDSYVMYYTEKIMKQDLLVLVPFVVVVIGVVLYVIFRSVLGVLIPLVTVGASVIWTVAIMIWQGIPISLVTMVMPVILVTIGSASSIHILTTYKEALARGFAKRAALTETFRVITSPVVMAAWTTSAGFASLVTAFVKPMREFGVLTAIGIFLAMVLSLSLVPALLILVKEPKVTLDKERTGGDTILTRFLHALSSLAVDHPRKLMIGVILVTLVFAYGATQVTLESNIVNYFSDSSPVKRGTQVIEDVFGGSMQISVVVDTGEADGMKDPAFVEELIHIQEYLNSWDTINNVTSMADVVRELNQALWDGDPAYYRVPETREGIAQQLLLFTMQGGSGLEALVTYDYSQALVTAQMKTLDASAMNHVMDEVEEYLEARYRDRDDLRVRLTGTPKVMMRLMNRYVQTQVSSLVSSSIAVGIIVALMMKSVVFGLISLVPLLFTVVINFGIMGLANLPLDAITSIIASLAIGIGVDYAVHYISRYRLELAAGQGVEEALRRAGSTTGRGIFFNALALILGFLVLAFSHFRAIAVFGYLISVTMIVSSLAALLVIPMAINYMEKRKLERGKGMKKTLLMLLVFAVTATATVAVATAQELTGQQILDAMSFDTILSGSGTAELTMITENARGAQRSYAVKVHLKTDDAGDKQFLEYLAPADVRGTKFLSINDEGQESQMWLYMPALGRERRIASHMTGDSFMGTDFTYDEIGGGFNYDDDYSTRRLGDEEVGDVACYVLELTADSADALYGKIQMWVRIDQMVPVKIAFFGEGELLAKTLSMDNYQSLSGDLIPHDLVMTDEVQGTRTILEITSMSQEDVADDIFTVRNLRR